MTRTGAVRRVGGWVAALCLAVSAASGGVAAEPASLRVGVLAFGTVNWELDVIKARGLDEKHGIRLDVVTLANKDATSIALQSNAADVIVSDWLWVSRQRDAGADFTFVPYSEAAGSLIVHPDSGIESLGDLDRKRLGVAGGPLDKSWLLLRAYAIKTLGHDLRARPAFAAPPLLSAKFLQRELDGVLNYWNYCAYLLASGMKELITVQELLPALGVPGRLPLIGYVFSERWAAENPDAIRAFLAASLEARDIMAESDEEWLRLKPLTGARDDATLIALRDGYRDGIPSSYGAEQEASIRAAFAIVAELGGRPLVGNSTELAPGTLWNGAF